MLLDVERVAHGGVCVAHAPDGRVVFVRHTLPGERVRVEITEERRSYLRADAVEIVEAAPARVQPPCPWAGPGRCGGCDWQHVALDEQRRLKAEVVREQLQRLAGIARDVVVEAVPGDVNGLGWRTRVRFAVDDDGRAGLRRHRSHSIEPIGDCLIAHPDIEARAVVETRWPGCEEVEVAVSSSGQRLVTPSNGRTEDDQLLEETVDGRSWQLPPGGFWQVHPGAVGTLRAIVEEFTDACPGERCLDLYAGVGIFADVLGRRAGSATVTAVESDRQAAAAGASALPEVHFVAARVEPWLRSNEQPVDVVVLDPPRKGAGKAVMQAIARCAPRVIAYVACDPAALARDVATAAADGYELTDLRALDLFPMTAHVECVARLARA
ncbi:MAG TPA: class I SAM-dependent RNA methyltransferase [Mycobacteriales bacterium]|nr:class I SAM-dependent RNA methyltransferase [Mycobacteriales bacterium]